MNFSKAFETAKRGAPHKWVMAAIEAHREGRIVFDIKDRQLSAWVGWA